MVEAPLQALVKAAVENQVEVAVIPKGETVGEAKVVLAPVVVAKNIKMPGLLQAFLFSCSNANSSIL